jgi:hypothetical protein
MNDLECGALVVREKHVIPCGVVIESRVDGDDYVAVNDEHIRALRDWLTEYIEEKGL